MPAVEAIRLVQAILDAVDASGQSGVFISSPRRHPRQFVISEAGQSALLWVYIWTLTPGGRPSLPNEYRIQMTTVTSPLPLNVGGATVLMGYEPNLSLFAGFDLDKHRTFTTGSPSVQIDVQVLRKAFHAGLAFDRKENNENAVGIRPDQFMTYVRYAQDLHRSGRDAVTLGLLEKVSALEPVNALEIEALPGERRRIVGSVSRLSRLANFRQQVLNAYGNRCAVTGVQLRLVEAAHILPVGAPGSIDDVRNGIALAPTYHRAFDAGLIYLTDDYDMRINRAREAVLSALKLHGGLSAFEAPLGKILCPPDRRQWPDVPLIRKANRFRQVEAATG